MKSVCFKIRFLFENTYQTILTNTNRILKKERKKPVTGLLTPLSALYSDLRTEANFCMHFAICRHNSHFASYRTCAYILDFHPEFHPTILYFPLLLFFRFPFFFDRNEWKTEMRQSFSSAGLKKEDKIKV